MYIIIAQCQVKWGSAMKNQNHGDALIDIYLYYDAIMTRTKIIMRIIDHLENAEIDEIDSKLWGQIETHIIEFLMFLKNNHVQLTSDALKLLFRDLEKSSQLYLTNYLLLIDLLVDTLFIRNYKIADFDIIKQKLYEKLEYFHDLSFNVILHLSNCIE